jgi:Cysteine rich repeat
MTRDIALIAAIALASFPSVTLAQQGSHSRGACRADAEKLCAGVEHGHGRILNCLAGQKEKLSDECRQMVESRGK